MMMSIPAFVGLIALLLLASPLVYLGGHLGSRWGLSTVAQRLALAILVIAWLPFIFAVRQFQLGGPVSHTIAGVPLTFDGVSLLLATIVLILGTIVVLFSGQYMAIESGRDKYYAMLLVMIGVMIGLGCAADLFNLWIWFEAMAVSSYLLVAFYKDQPSSLEAGVKYLMQSAAGSVLVLLGIGLVLATSGTLNLDEIHSTTATSTTLLAAGALFVIGFGVKTALVPLHTWLPDAHSEAPSGISAMLSGIVIEVGLLAMLRSLGALAPTTVNWGVILMTFGAINMLVGNLMALRQRQVKRLLAYSSLVHVGYMLVGIGIAVYVQEVNGAQGGMFHLFNHGLMKGLAFLAAGAFLYTLHIAAGDHAPLTTLDLSGAARRYPWAGLALSLALLSLGGLPPLAGFMSKWQIFSAGFQTHNLFIGMLVVFAALNSVFSLVYYAPLVNIVYRRKPSIVVEEGGSLPFSMEVTLLVLALAVIAIGLWPSSMNWLTEPAGTALLAPFVS
jgi:proton-translocating NADH-quinone oxidoreductase chain N